MPAKDRAVYWVEHVLRHGGTKHLQSNAKKMPLYQVYLLDVWAFIIFILLVVLYIAVKSIKWFLRCLCSSKKLKTQ